MDFIDILEPDDNGITKNIIVAAINFNIVTWDKTSTFKIWSSSAYQDYPYLDFEEIETWTEDSNIENVEQASKIAWKKINDDWR